MTKRDRWVERLRCYSCGVTDGVVLSQASSASLAYHDGDDQNVRVEQAPSGFNFAVTEFGCEFFCASCGRRARHEIPD
jgi:hypothetical protein